MLRNRICHKEYATVISREGRNRESGRRRSLCEATASILEQNGVSVAEDGISSCASILEEKGALTRSYSLYFRGEVLVEEDGILLSILEDRQTEREIERERERTRTLFSPRAEASRKEHLLSEAGLNPRPLG